MTQRTARARTRAAEREDRKGEAADLYALARSATGRTVADLAAETGVSETKVRAWEDRDAGTSPVPLDAVMVGSLARVAVQFLAERVGMVAVELPSTSGPHDDLRLLAEVQRETSDVVRAFLAAIEDGAWTRGENAEVRVEAWEAIRALVRLVRTLEATAHEPVMGVRRTH